MSVLRIEKLTKKFGKFTALRGVDLKVGQGEIVGFIGPNGAGKTTTIRALLGILRPTSGAVSIFGKDAWKDAVEIHKRLAYVPGDVNLWPNLTGGQVIDLLMNLHGGGNREKREELMERFQLDPTKKCRTYSKGNRQKVALIAAFAVEADFYVLDEPTSGLDPLMESVFHDCVLAAKASGKSILLSSHILSEVEKLCDRVVIIKSGEIVESGTLDELRHLTRSRVSVKTVKVPDLGHLNGVYQVEALGNQLSFEVDADALGGVIAYLSQYEIQDLQCSPPSLEEMFLTHYERSGQP